MSTVAQFDGDMMVRGTFRATVNTPSAGAISNNHVAADAALAATKLIQRHRRGHAQESATTAASESRTLHVVYGATGTLIAFEAGCIVANIGAATVTFDLLKNGASVLAGVITVDSTHTAREVVSGTLAGTSIVDGDVLEVAIVATAGGGTLGKGAFCSLTLDESPV